MRDEKRLSGFLTVLSVALVAFLFNCPPPDSGGGTPSLSNAKAIIAYGFTSPSATGSIDEINHTIAVAVPFGTSKTALVATYTTTGKTVKVGGTLQTSGGSANDFANAVTYTVTAEDSTTQEYIVTVTVAPSDAKAFTAFGFPAVSATGTINEADHTIAVTIPFGTSKAGLVARFTSTGQSVKIAGALQTSDTTSNDFTNSVTYTVTAADNSTQDYVVTVTVAPSNVKIMLTFSLAGITSTITETNHTIHAPVPSTANVSSLAASFTFTGQSVKVGSTVQTSGSTLNNFSGVVTYTVYAADNSSQDYTVTVLKSPSSLTATTVSTSQINLTWSDNSNNETGFKIERKPVSSGSFAAAGTVGANATSFSDTVGLTENTQYDYRVYAYDALGNSLYTTESSGWTSPNAPSNLLFTSISYTDDGEYRKTSSFNITFTWTDNSTCTYDYLYASDDSGATYYMSNMGVSPLTANAIEKSGTWGPLNEYTTYYFHVKANNTGIESAASNVCIIKTPLYRPHISSGGFYSSDGIHWNPIIRVDDASLLEDGYKIERSDASTGPFTTVGTIGPIAGIVGSGTFFGDYYYNYTDSTATVSGHTYYYRVRTYKGSDYSEYSGVMPMTDM